jgi:paraquat-inducible protein A
MTSHRSRVAVCTDCDAVQTLDRGAARGGALCFRCGAVLARGGGDRMGRAAALTIAAIPLFVAASSFPLVRLDSAGQRIDATVIGAVGALAGQHRQGLAVLVLLLAAVLPAIWLGGVAYLLLAWRRRRAGGALGAVFNLVEVVAPWSQLEIFLLALLVAFAKLATVFHVVPGAALPCLVGFLLLAHIVSASIDRRRYWRRFETTP